MDKAARSSNVTHIISAALSLIAEGGLDNFTYRGLAAHAGMTLGEVTSRVGRKTNLLQLLIERTLAAQAESHDYWQKRLAGVALRSPSELAAILGAYIRECRGRRRNEAVFWCEMIAERERVEAAAIFVQSYSTAEGRFWHQVIDQWAVGDPGELAPLIRDYCFGEIGFMLTLGDNPDYEIALALNLDLLAQKMFSHQAAADAYGDELLSALRRSQGKSDTEIKLQGQRLEVAQAAGRLFMKNGLSGLTHRATAEELEVSAAAISHYFRTKTELINAALWAIHLIIREDIDGTSADAAPKISARSEIKRPNFLFLAIHGLVLAGLRKEEIRPILLRERLERGRSTADWLGRPQDAVLTQVASIISYGATLTQSEDRLGGDHEGNSTHFMITNVFLKIRHSN